MLFLTLINKYFQPPAMPLVYVRQKLYNELIKLNEQPSEVINRLLERYLKNMKKDRTWDSFLNVLCIYYDVPPVFARVNKRISAVAHYIEAINLIETKE